MKNNKGFTLVELLAVIVIMGILMMVAIPSVTRTIENSRKDSFVDIAKIYANAVRTLWLADGLTCEGTISSAVDDGDYYIFINTKEGARESLPVLVDQGGKSSWGNRDVNGYVRVNISTTPGVDNDGDGVLDVEPKRLTKFYVALSDGTHGVVDDNTTTMDGLVRGNVVMTLTAEQLKKTQLTVDDGRLDCAKDSEGMYLCTEVTPVTNITGVCVDDQTNVGVTGNYEVPTSSFAEDDWDTIVLAIRSGRHPYSIGDTKQVVLDGFGTYNVRLANLSRPGECNNVNFSQTACGTVIEFEESIIDYMRMSNTSTNTGGWSETEVREKLNTTVYNALPSDLQRKILDTKVVSGHGTLDTNNITTIDKLYLLSSKEVWETGSNAGFVSGLNKDTAKDSTRQLDYYKENNVTADDWSNARKKAGEYYSAWWLRTSEGGFLFQLVTATGYIGSENVDTGSEWGTNNYDGDGAGISPAFRIG